MYFEGRVLPAFPGCSFRELWLQFSAGGKWVGHGLMLICQMDALEIFLSTCILLFWDDATMQPQSFLLAAWKAPSLETFEDSQKIQALHPNPSTAASPTALPAQNFGNGPGFISFLPLPALLVAPQQIFLHLQPLGFQVA